MKNPTIQLWELANQEARDMFDMSLTSLYKEYPLLGNDVLHGAYKALHPGEDF